ncbi:MAG TPA: hypothetical protein VMT32_21325 [Bryobacteraceae bacterium]|nr:hypothetical protein [Bryobacteraceae bacterium]
MATVTGSFTGKVKVQTAIAASDQSNHELNLAEIRGTQKSSDENWNNAAITYWGVTDVVDGQGTQRGYFENVHTSGDRDWGTFEGTVAAKGGQITVEGRYQNNGGTGKFNGLTGNGTFKTTMSSPTDVEASWQGAYELASAKAQAG